MRVASLALVLGSSLLLACAPDTDLFGSNGASSGSGGAGHGGGGASHTTSASSSSGASSSSSSSSSSSGNPCQSGPNTDIDGDGFTPSDGDCNDCDPTVSPGNLDLPGNLKDEDCDGSIDNAPGACDQNLAFDSPDPLAAAQAIGLCKTAGVKDWGVVAAKWVVADGATPPTDPTQLANFHLGHGVLSGFGPNVAPREGARVLSLSSGTARQPMDAGYVQKTLAKGYNSKFPSGFPKDSTMACPGVATTELWDSTAVEITVRAPKNVTGISYAFDFYTHDFPQFICSSYNDTFFAILSPSPAGHPDGAIAFDKAGSPVSVNGAAWEVCGCNNGPPCTANGKSFTCMLGVSQLASTGFEGDNNNPGGYAATGWQITTAPVAPGAEFTIRFGVYDGSDQVNDATALVDAFTWVVDPNVTVATTVAP